VNTRQFGLALVSLMLLGIAVPAFAQRPLTGADSALVARILLAEDQRDASSPAFAEGARHADPRIRMIARRAAARSGDPRFAARDSFPAPAAPPVYPDPAWRLRYRALAASRSDCAALRGALADSTWPVRLRAADLVGPACAGDSVLVQTLLRWAVAPMSSGERRRNGVSWQASAHALVALARIDPGTAGLFLSRSASNPVPWLRVYAARAAGVLADTVLLRRLANDIDDNVKEAALEALARLPGHVADDEALAALYAHGYQAVRAAALALHGSPRGDDVLSASLATAQRLRADSSETSRDARLAVLALIGEFATAANTADIAALAADFDCVVADSAAAITARLGAAAPARCTPLPIELPAGAVMLALGAEARLRVTLADSSGGGSFTVRLRGDMAPIMGARIIALVLAGAYDGRVWQRVESDFVLQGGGTGANEYTGHPRFIRDELGTLAHQRGTVGMSTRGHDTGDGQWFVNLRDNPRLTRDYSVFAEVVDGIDIVDGVMEGDVIARIEIVR